MHNDISKFETVSLSSGNDSNVWHKGICLNIKFSVNASISFSAAAKENANGLSIN